MQSTSVFEGIFKLLEWFTRFALTNFLWVLFNLPISFFVFTILLTDDVPFIVMNLLFIAVLAPFLFFPATSAMFGVVRKWITGEHDFSIIKQYWALYRENYGKSLLGGLILVPLWAIGIADIAFLVKQNIYVTIILLMILLLLFIFTTYFFAVIVHHNIKLFPAFKQALIFMIIHPGKSLIVGIMNLAILYLCLTKLTFLMPFLMGVAIAYFAFFSYYAKFKTVQQLKREN